MKLLILDTETLGLYDQRVYNLGYLIYDTETKTTIKARDYVIKEIYDNNRLMQTAYYYDKKPLYEMRIANGTCKKINWTYALRVLAREIKKYNVATMYAFNSRFDIKSIEKTCKYYHTKNPATEISDIWKGQANPKITTQQAYIDFCKNNGFMTKHKKPRPRENAQTLYAYITNNTNYVEEHTALEDSKIELEILKTALGLLE